MSILDSEIHDEWQTRYDEASESEDSGPDDPVEGCHARGAIHAGLATLRAGQALEGIGNGV